MGFTAKCITTSDDELDVQHNTGGFFSVCVDTHGERAVVNMSRVDARVFAHWLISELGEGATALVEATPKGGAAFAKAGEIVRIGGLIGETDKANRCLVPMHGKSSSVEFGKADAVRLVSLIEGPDVVHVMKVLAVVSRSARIEE